MITIGEGSKGVENIAGDIEVQHYDKSAFARPWFKKKQQEESDY